MKRKLLSIVLALSVMLTLLPTAALAEGDGGQGSSEPQTPYLKMECNSRPKTSFELSSGSYDVRFYIEDGSNSYYPTKDQITLTCTGAVTGIAYSRTVTESSFTADYWTMTVSDTEGSGSISGTLTHEGATIDLGTITVTSTGKQAKSGTFAVQYDGDPYSAGETLTLPVGEHTVVLMVGESFLDTLDFVTCGGCISKIEKSGQQDSIQLWKLTVSNSGDGTGYIQYNGESNRVTITRGSSGQGEGGQGQTPTPPAGTLTMKCNGNTYTNRVSLSAKNHDVELYVKTENNEFYLTDFTNYLTVSDAVEKIERNTINVGGQNVALLKLSVAGEVGATGTITYTAPDGTTSTITVTVSGSSGQGGDPSGEPSSGPTYGDEVQDADRARIDAQSDDYFYWDNTGHGAIAVPFTYNGETYYLGTCAWDENSSAISPKGHGSRGLTDNNNTLVLSVRVFEVRTGEASGANASYALREDIRAAMIGAGYKFQLVVRPTTLGCRYYPATESSDWSVKIDETTSAGDWTKLTFDKEHCAGCWVFEGQLRKGGKLEASSTASERMSRMDTIRVTLEGGSEAINTQIANELAKYTNLSELEYPNVEFTLPGGELTGELVIPETGCFVSLQGAGARDGKIKTTINGGVKIESEGMVEAVYIHFVGAGKTAETTSDGKPNSALYGTGEGLPRQCILENYYCAVQSEKRTVWGANRSVFRNNHIGIHANSEGSGNLQLQNSWFVGNDIALQVDNTTIAAITPSGCCFVNNGEDLRNNCRYDLWLSGNFFYHASILGQLTGADTWEPVLWTTDEEGTITLNIDSSNRDRINDTSGNTRTFNTSDYFIAEFQEAAVQTLYGAFLPVVAGSSRTFAMPLACTPACNTFYYPRFSLYKPSWWDYYPFYPYVVPEGQKVTKEERDAGVPAWSEDKDNGTMVRFDFGAGHGNAGRNAQ